MPLRFRFIAHILNLETTKCLFKLFSFRLSWGHTAALHSTTQKSYLYLSSFFREGLSVVQIIILDQ